MLRSGVTRTTITTMISRTIPPTDIPLSGCSTGSAGGAAICGVVICTPASCAITCPIRVVTVSSASL